METTEFVHQTARQLLERLDEARALLERVEDQPIRFPSNPRCVYRELLATGMPHDDAWKYATDLVGQRNDAKRLIGELRTEVEVFVDIADDAIGKTGRLV